MAYLGEPTITMRTLEDSSRYRLGVGNACLGIEFHLCVASLRLGLEPASVDEDTCLCLGEARLA